MNHETLIQTFYKAFAQGDAEKMVSCYHDQIQFEDPAFGKLTGEEAKNMWRMLIERSKGDIKIGFQNIRADEHYGSAEWQAEYVFGQTGRPVVNKIKASFEFKEGKIIRHTDQFNLWKWSSQALGLSGYLLGWSSLMQNKIQSQTRKLLKHYTEKRMKNQP